MKLTKQFTHFRILFAKRGKNLRIYLTGRTFREIIHKLIN